MNENRVLALVLPGHPNPGEAERLIRASLGEAWGALEVEEFPGRGETLLLIRPARGVYIDRRAAELLGLTGVL